MAVIKNLRKLGILNVTAMFVCSMLISTFALLLPATPVSAVLDPLPEPVSPGANCAWMGEAQYSISENSDSWSTGYHNSFDHNVNMASSPVDGQSCGMVWNGDYNHTTTQPYNGFCSTPGAGDTITRTVLGGESGTGNYTTSFNSFDNSFRLNALTLTGASLNTEFTFDLASQTCSIGIDPPTSNTQFQIYTGTCYGSNVVQTGFIMNPSTQASVGSCIEDYTFSDANNTFTRNMEITWRFKKVNCDTTVDSDGGGTPDCLEYDDRTNPMNASDDILRTSPEVQSVITIAETSGDECFGKVTQSAAATSAATGKGVKQVIEEWNFTGLSGVTEDSTFQQKKDALQSFCKAN